MGIAPGSGPWPGGSVSVSCPGTGTYTCNSQHGSVSGSISAFGTSVVLNACDCTGSGGACISAPQIGQTVAPGCVVTNRSIQYASSACLTNGQYGYLGLEVKCTVPDTCTNGTARQCQSPTKPNGCGADGYSRDNTPGLTCASGTNCCKVDPPTATPSPTRTPTPTPTPKPPACGEACPTNGTSCPAGCPCTGGICKTPETPTATPTPKPPACGEACPTNGTSCPAGCPCTGGICKTPPGVPTATPTTPPPACGEACPTNGTSCPAGCPCTGGICKTPEVPTATPTPTSPPLSCGDSCETRTDCPAGCPCTGPSGSRKCAAPTATPTATPTPDPFSPAMCKCDNMEISGIGSGLATKVTAFGKVEGADTTHAKIQSMKFFLGKGPAGSTKIVLQSGDLAATIIEEAAAKVRYKSVWDFTMPALDRGVEHRLWTTFKCIKKIAFEPGITGNSVVLGAHDNASIFSKIFAFFANLGPEDKEIAQKPAPTPELVARAEKATSQGQVLGEKRSKLQLETFIPGEVTKKACQTIYFKLK